MKLFALALLLAPLPLAAQTDAAAALPTDPNQLLNAAAPFYDYTSPDMKSWHAHYHYQTFDQSGAPLREGDFDYWWSTAKVSKASWRYGNQSHIEWHTADGKELRSGANLIQGIEEVLTSAFLPGFLDIKDSHSADRPLKYFTAVVASQPVACVGSARTSTVEDRPSTTPGERQLVIKKSTGDEKIDSLDSLSPGYCFDTHAPVLIAKHFSGTLTTLFSDNHKFQNHNFPGQITILYVGAKRVVARLADLSEVHTDDAAFTPSPDATIYVPHTVTKIAPLIQMAPLVPIDKVDPVYPEPARAARIGGTVVIEATITKDGKVKDPTIVSSPNDLLSAAAIDAVRRWRYKPQLVNGQPTEIHTKINVGFTP